jgi:hypothetical protein
MRLASPPTTASWVHRDSREGFEVLFVESHDGRRRLHGNTTAREGAHLWSVGYDIELDAAWNTRSARVTSRSPEGARGVSLVHLRGAGWTVDGVPRPDLDGCVDVDLESSAVTNTLPVHRMEFEPGARVEASAVYVRAGDLGVERLEQYYTLVAAADAGPAFFYESPGSHFSCELRFDTAGFVVDYPHIAVRDR